MFLNLLNNYVTLDQKEKKTRIAMRSNGPQKQVSYCSYLPNLHFAP